MRWPAALLLFLVPPFESTPSGLAQDKHEGLSEAELAVRALRPAPGLQVTLFAAEPQLRNPSSFTIDEKGGFYVVETHRRRTSVLDIRTKIDWLDEDLACRT